MRQQDQQQAFSAGGSTMRSLDQENNNNEIMNSQDRENKRIAQGGQWRTPPIPFFPSNSSSASGAIGNNAVGQPQQQQQQQAVPISVVSSGGATDAATRVMTAPSATAAAAAMQGYDIATLQEAYRKGMEAAAALSQHQLNTGQNIFLPGTVPQAEAPVSNSVSCPNLQDYPQVLTVDQLPNVEEPLEGQMGQQQQNYPIATAGAPLVLQQHQHTHPGSAMANFAPAGEFNPQHHQGQAQMIQQQNQALGHMDPNQQQNLMAAAAPRSVSLPDMASYAVKASQEEDKRKKRLARNRASARLRRLRKKNLVESYEAEVGVLEASLARLRAHDWGTGNHDALIDALSMDRGQQPLPPQARRDLIKGILSQQREQVEHLMDAQLESMILGWVVRGGSTATSENLPAADATKKSEDEQRKKEEHDLARELGEVLNLSPEQALQLQKATDGAEEERKAIQTVDICLEAMMNNNWLMNHGVEECTEQFTSILNAGQMSKFLLWTDHNSEAIDQLDYVNAPSASALPAESPTFIFGTDDCNLLNMDDGDER